MFSYQLDTSKITEDNFTSDVVKCRRFTSGGGVLFGCSGYSHCIMNNELYNKCNIVLDWYGGREVYKLEKLQGSTLHKKHDHTKQGISMK